jgi:hypothetical protein
MSQAQALLLFIGIVVVAFGAILWFGNVEPNPDHETGADPESHDSPTDGHSGGTDGPSIGLLGDFVSVAAVEQWAEPDGRATGARRLVSAVFDRHRAARGV